MNTLLPSSQRLSPVVFAWQPSQLETSAQARASLQLPEHMQVSASALTTRQANPIVLSPRRLTTVHRDAPQQAGFEEKLFDACVRLKVLVAQYAMHLSKDERQQIFEQLDDVLNPADWYVEDIFPKQTAFQELLKWSVYSKNYEWRSLGVSDTGDVLVAWLSEAVRLTASFAGDGIVRWTARVRSQTGVEHAAGSSSLQYFDRQARFYLQQ